MHRSGAALLPVLVLAVTLPVSAATVEVLVRERGAGPIADVQVRLILEGGDPNSPFAVYSGGKTAVTDRAGKAEFANVGEGSYRVELGRIADPFLVRPQDNPWAPLPRRKITANDERISIVVELWRGSQVIVRWLADPQSSKPATMVLTSTEGSSVRLLSTPGEPYRKALAPGRWVASLEQPEGYVLEDLEVDGVSIAGATATLEIAEGSPPRDVRWKLAAPCLIEGRVDVVGEPQGPWSVGASLVEPGAWAEAAVARGSPVPGHVAGSQIDEQHYEIHLPAGRWRIEPRGEGLTASEPGPVDVTLAPGETRRIDFQLRYTDDAVSLRVWVVDPDRKRLSGAHVEVRAMDASGRLGATVGAEAADPVAVFRGLPAGRYTVVAAHPDFVEASTTTSVGDDNAPPHGRVEVMLTRGASLRVHATRTNGDPVSGVRIEATHKGPIDTLLTVAELVEKKTRVVTRTDLTGIAELSGLYPGHYTVEGVVDEALDGAYLVTFGKADEPPVAASVELAGQERQELEAKVVTAAGIAGRLQCGEGALSAPTASIRVIPTLEARDAWDDPELRKGAVLAIDRLPLRGSALDRFTVGPIPPGSYKIAIRPTGDEAWTWVGGGLGVRNAIMVHVERATTEDVGTVVAECGPVIVLVPSLASGEPAPELDPKLLRVDAARPGTGSAPGEVLPLRQEVLGTTAVVLGLPEGDVKVRARIEHDYLDPSMIEQRTTVHDMKRGKLIRFDYRFHALGGYLEVRAAGTAIRVLDAEQHPRLAMVEDGVAFLRGLPPGRYRVDACADEKCETSIRTWPAVEIGAGRRTYLP